MIARRVVLQSGKLEAAIDALLARAGGPPGPTVATMCVKQAAAMQALLPQSILSSKLSFVPVNNRG